MNIFDIKDIQKICASGKIKWSLHSAKRILQRGISREDVISAIMEGEIIEEYPSNWPHPACLIYGSIEDSSNIIHVVVGINDYIHIITAYYPDTELFEDDLKSRRK